ESQADALRRQYESDLKLPKCPRCHRGGKGFHEAIQQHFEAEMGELAKENEKCLESLSVAQKQANALTVEYEKALLADKTAQESQLELQALKSDLQRLETVVQTRSGWQKQLDGLKAIEAPESALITKMMDQE